ncbi:hypothetical protein [Saccharomonospora sp. CUA-673]|nr:hypothetical protein [Saccharomonospora sp. CUA-673]
MWVEEGGPAIATALELFRERADEQERSKRSSRAPTDRSGRQYSG